VTNRINCTCHLATEGESIYLPLMTDEPLGLRPTHDLSRLGLSALAVYRTRNTMGHTKTHATKARGRRGTETVMMMSGLFAAHAASHKERNQERPNDRYTCRQT
jgi:hypothetical protein